MKAYSFCLMLIWSDAAAILTLPVICGSLFFVSKVKMIWNRLWSFLIHEHLAENGWIENPGLNTDYFKGGQI